MDADLVGLRDDQFAEDWHELYEERVPAGRPCLLLWFVVGLRRAQGGELLQDEDHLVVAGVRELYGAVAELVLRKLPQNLLALVEKDRTGQRRDALLHGWQRVALPLFASFLRLLRSLLDRIVLRLLRASQLAEVEEALQVVVGERGAGLRVGLALHHVVLLEEL